MSQRSSCINLGCCYVRNEKVKFFDDVEFDGTNDWNSLIQWDNCGADKLTWSATSSNFDNNSALAMFERKSLLKSKPIFKLVFRKGNDYFCPSGEIMYKNILNFKPLESILKEYTLNFRRLRKIVSYEFFWCDTSRLSLNFIFARDNELFLTLNMIHFCKSTIHSTQLRLYVLCTSDITDVFLSFDK